ncbi:MAG TPA: DEAD/DEAH box helicase family protein [Campylobacter avium]|uniref:DEAD/DEAH box helicase n=1 Tax=Campylobacter avium TaxID=522485 RepID=UPI001D3B864F|nr:DEAD/DEAH box helicase family protein [Campylobacter avium]HJE66837.1 DEAD/DEAH box helicase family protein [Campylobacter avium]
MKQEILEIQDRAVSELLYLAKSGKSSISLKAPTGSGKTHIMARLMNEMLKENENLVFLVSTISKGRLASQNYERFNELSLKFTRLKPFYISSEKDAKNKEYSIHIDTSFNVFVLPSAQYTKTSKINKEKSLLIFLQRCKEESKKVILLRDESHIATNNLNELSSYFSQTIHFSATPKDDKYDVKIDEKEAERANLIKTVEYIDEKEELEKGLNRALDKFKSIQNFYFKEGIRPAFIIQISNKDFGKNEMKEIKQILEKQGLRWVCFVEKEKDYESNTRLEKLKNKSLWQNYVKENDSFIDVIIFKMVITEGFDIPRACMLYQVRDTNSKQLDEQVIGRVRRNPCLKRFEYLDKETQEIFSKAYIYGMKPMEKSKKRIRLKGEMHKNLFENEIIKEFGKFEIIVLKEIHMGDIDIRDCLKNLKEYDSESIFEKYKKLQKVSEVVKRKQKEFVKTYEDWFLFSQNLKAIQDKLNSVVEDYEKYAQIEKVELREDIYSFYDSRGESVWLDNWIWSDSKEEEFSFDSEAEKEFCKILYTLCEKSCKKISINGKEIYLFGKNFIDKSNVKFDYYHLRKRTSYPDFIFKDIKNKIHIFEVKSVNQSKSFALDDEEYKEKIEKLKKAYTFASKKTGYIFYLPVKNGDDWSIWRCENGKVDEEAKRMNKAMFAEYMNGGA